MIGFLGRIRHLFSWFLHSLSRDPAATLAKLFKPTAWAKIPRAIANPEASQLIQRTWQFKGAFRQRAYGSYEEYLSHQSTKFDTLGHDARDVYGGLTDPKLIDKLNHHRATFVACSDLPPRSSVLCMAARAGFEVKALRDLGHFAVGIDLNPGPNNAYVTWGDFHNLAFADATVDAVYTNALDHALELPRILTEVKRVLRPGGLFIVEIIDGYDEGHTADHYDCLHWPVAHGFYEHLAAVGGFTQVRFEKIRPNTRWNLGLLRKD